MGMILAVAQALLGLALLTNTRHLELGITNLVLGLLFIWLGIRSRRRVASKDREFSSAVAHLDEINQRMQRGETPDQIAEALDAGFGVPPIRTLHLIAMDRLREMGHGRDEQQTALSLNWTASGREETLPPVDAVLDRLDARKNVHGGAGDVALHPPPGTPGTLVKGGLVATRTHLFFLPLLHNESIGDWAAKEAAVSRLPGIFGIANLAEDVTKAVQAELTVGFPPARIAEYKASLARPGGFAVAWREFVGVRKEHLEGRGPPRSFLLIGYGDDASPTERWLTQGRGFDEGWVDDWIDAVRLACLLEGKLLAL
jgi:hypothetical protein